MAIRMDGHATGDFVDAAAVGDHDARVEKWLEVAGEFAFKLFYTDRLRLNLAKVFGEKRHEPVSFPEVFAFEDDRVCLECCGHDRKEALPVSSISCTLALGFPSSPAYRIFV